jgi:hypothetical protein
MGSRWICQYFCFAPQPKSAGVPGKPAMLVLACADYEDENVIAIFANLEKTEGPPWYVIGIESNLRQAATFFA